MPAEIRRSSSGHQPWNLRRLLNTAVAALPLLANAAGAMAMGNDTLSHPSRALRTLGNPPPPAPPIPVMPSPASARSFPVQDTPYDVTLPPFPVTYDNATRAAQRSAGSAMVNAVQTAVAQGQKNYTIAPGVYRLAQPLVLLGTQDLTLNAAGVELISDQGIVHFRLLNNTNLQVRGPITLDADPFGFSQGTIINTDNRTFIDLQVMQGYAFPQPNCRVMFFTPDGTMLPHYQDVATTVDNLGNNQARLHFPVGTFTSFPETLQGIIQVGNLMSLENPSQSGGGVEMRANNGVSFSDVNFHSYATFWGLPEYGAQHYDNLFCDRRPGTNRLNAGGYFQIKFDGGDFRLSNSRIGYNYDDLSDLFNGMNYGMSQVSPNQVMAALGGADIGETLNFYDYATLQQTGSATLTAITPVSDPTVLAQWAATTAAHNLLNLLSPSLITLDRNISMPGLAIIDSQNQRATRMEITNSYFHDNLAGGIQAKGAKQVVIAGNRVDRVCAHGISSGYDPYWWEGGIPSNITIFNNTVTNTSYCLGGDYPAITVYNIKPATPWEPRFTTSISPATPSPILTRWASVSTTPIM